MSDPVRISLVGAGLIGRRHGEVLRGASNARLASIVDPSEEARALAQSWDVPWFADMTEMLASNHTQGVIIATPNRLHKDYGLQAVAAGLPALIEKPLCDDVEDAEALVGMAEAAKVPLLVGHHRRYNPRISRAKEIMDKGRLGRVVTVHGMFWLFKPDDYFDVAWRREDGAGPILINLIHDVDLLRHLCGDIVSVRALTSNATRGFEVEDTACALLRFSSGALGTLTASDTVSAPWSWEHTAGENPAYPHTDQACYLIGGTHGSLSLPSGEIWEHREQRSWWEPLTTERGFAPKVDPLPLQIAHFADVIRGKANPLVTGHDGLAALKVLRALKASAQSGREELISA